MHNQPTAKAVLPSLINDRAKHSPDSTFASFPSDEETRSRITFSQFAQACHRFARIISPQDVDRQEGAVGIIANCDTILYLTATAGLVCGGMTAFPISPRLPPAAICHLLKRASVHLLLVTSASSTADVHAIRDSLAAEGHELEMKELPSLPDVYPQYTSSQTGIDGAPELLDPLPEVPAFSNDTEMFIHSSGSTGLPKAIPYSHEFVQKMKYQDSFIGYPEDMVLFSGMLPSFHTMGFCFQLLFPLYTGRPVALFEPQFPNLPVLPSPAVVLDAMRRSQATAACLIPAFLELWSRDAAAVATLGALHTIIYGGGPLAPEVGDFLIASGCNLVGGYGCTEAGCVTKFHGVSRGRDWAWSEIADTATSRWMDQGGGLYELQLLSSDTQALAIENLPDVRGYATQDLWVQHPEQKNLWRPVGRVDDVIVMANGEKTVPGPIEGALLAHPLVKGALAFGRGRDQIGVLVEPHTALGEKTLEQFRNEIWSAIAAGNKLVPTFSRVFKEMVLVTAVDKALPRAAKGTVNRKAALDQYTQEIDDLYLTVANVDEGSSERPRSWEDTAHVADWIHQLASSLVERDLRRNVDLFVQGYDSLTATVLRRRIMSALQDAPKDLVQIISDKVTQDFVYVNPTIERMASAIVDHTAGQQQHKLSAESEISALFQEYAKGMSSLATSGSRRLDGGLCVMLTGSTGSLGTHIMTRLIRDERVARVWAYNRPSKTGEDPASRHKKAFSSRGLDVSELGSAKVFFLEGNAHESKLDLIDEDYQKLLASVDVIIHNAWPLDFNLGVKNFEQNIASTRRLIDLAMESPKASHARLLFTSSIAVARNWPSTQGDFPEESMPTPEYCLGSGYGEAKYVAEKLLTAARENGLQTTSVRIGQITGSRANGAWATSDWVPIMIKSSITIGSLPDAVGLVSWISPDAVAQAFIDLVFADGLVPPTINLCHPQPVPWSQVVADIANTLAEHGARLKLNSFDQWFSLLQNRGDALGADELDSIPAVKLLSFFGRTAEAEHTSQAARLDNKEAFGVAPLDIRQAQAICPSLSNERGLQSGDVQRWISYWRECGFIVFD